MKPTDKQSHRMSRTAFMRRAVTATALFVASGALALVISSCSDAPATAPSAKPNASFQLSSMMSGQANSFYGHMIPGGAIDYPSGAFIGPYAPPTQIITIGTLRAWDGGFMWAFIGDGTIRQTGWDSNGQPTYQNASYYWDGVDGFLNAAQNLGAIPMYTFGASEIAKIPASVRRAGLYSEFPTHDAWTAFVNLLLDHAAGRFKIFEMWNEPALIWPSGTDTLLFNQSAAGYSIIKTRVPGAIVLTPSFAGLTAYTDSTGDHPAWGYAAAVQYFSRMAAPGAPVSADAIAFHSYAPDKMQDYNAIKQLATSYGFGGLPIYLTETAGDAHQILTSMASVGVTTVVFNAQIDDDLDKASALGQVWQNTYDELMQAPSSTPTQLGMQGASGGRGRGVWTNTSSTASIELEFYSRQESGQFQLALSDSKPAGTTSTQYYNFDVGDQVYFRARYVNGGIAGAWSANSNAVLLH